MRFELVGAAVRTAAESAGGAGPRSPPASAVHGEWGFLRPAPAAVRTATNRVTSLAPGLY